MNGAPPSPAATRTGARDVMVFGSLLTVLIPPCSFLVVALLNDMGISVALDALREQCTQHRQNPLLTAIPSLLPLWLFAGLLWLRGRRRAMPNATVFAMVGTVADSKNRSSPKLGSRPPDH